MSRGMLPPTKRDKLKYAAPPKMTTKQAEIFWNALTIEQKRQFAEMYPKLCNGDLMLESVNVDENEEIQNIVLTPKDKKGKPDKPFYNHFTPLAGTDSD